MTDDCHVNNNVERFKELLLRNPTHDSWLLKWQIHTPRGATYVRGGWLQTLHAEMGRAASGTPHLQAHRRWVHVFLNGLYRGAYELSERIDDDFGKSYLVDFADYDVLKFSGNNDGVLTTAEKDGLTDGDYAAWDLLRTHCQNAAANPTDGVSKFHGILRDHPAYQQAFRNRVDLHFRTPGGLMTPVTGGGLREGYQLLQDEMNRFGGVRDSNGTIITPGVITSESARWGDGSPDLSVSLGYDDTSEYGPGWRTRSETLRDGYDAWRRQNFLDALDALGLLNP